MPVFFSLGLSLGPPDTRDFASPDARNSATVTSWRSRKNGDSFTSRSRRPSYSPVSPVSIVGSPIQYAPPFTQTSFAAGEVEQGVSSASGETPTTATGSGADVVGNATSATRSVIPT